MAEERRVESVHKIDGKISHIIGFWGPNHKEEAVSVQEAIEQIKSCQYIYYTLYITRHKARIVPRGEGPEAYLATEPDFFVQNNLTYLGQCNLLEDLPERENPWMFCL